MTHISRICCQISLDISAIRAYLTHRLYGLHLNGIGGSFQDVESADCEAAYQLQPMLDLHGLYRIFSWRNA